MASPAQKSEKPKRFANVFVTALVAIGGVMVLAIIAGKMAALG